MYAILIFAQRGEIYMVILVGAAKFLYDVFLIVPNPEGHVINST